MSTVSPIKVWLLPPVSTILCLCCGRVGQNAACPWGPLKLVDHRPVLHQQPQWFSSPAEVPLIDQAQNIAASSYLVQILLASMNDR